MSGTWNRREFVGACAGAAASRRALLRSVSRSAAGSIVFLTVGASGAAFEGLRRGAAIGRSEVLQTAALLRKPLSVEAIDAPDAPAALTLLAGIRQQRERPLAIIIAGEDEPVATIAASWHRDGPLLIATAAVAPSCSGNVFTVAPSAGDRDAALGAWHATAGDSAGQAGGGRQSVSAWSSSLVIYGADSLNQRFMAAWPHPPDEAEWSQWFAIKIVAEAALRSGASGAAQLGDALVHGGSDGHKGVMLRFDVRRHLRQPLYVVAPDGGDGATRVLYTWQPTDADQVTGSC